jgi:hypothetical protein
MIVELLLNHEQTLGVVRYFEVQFFEMNRLFQELLHLGIKINKQFLKRIEYDLLARKIKQKNQVYMCFRVFDENCGCEA